jgi:hypothetical protein
MSGKWNFNAMNIFSLFMVLVYIGLGIFLLITDKFDYVPSAFRTVFAGILILYGIFRFVRVYFKIKNPEQ